MPASALAASESETDEPEDEQHHRYEPEEVHSEPKDAKEQDDKQCQQQDHLRSPMSRR
jgi:hypothetical protein